MDYWWCRFGGWGWGVGNVGLLLLLLVLVDDHHANNIQFDIIGSEVMPLGRMPAVTTRKLLGRNKCQESNGLRSLKWFCYGNRIETTMWTTDKWNYYYYYYYLKAIIFKTSTSWHYHGVTLYGRTRQNASIITRIAIITVILIIIIIIIMIASNLLCLDISHRDLHMCCSHSVCGLKIAERTS